MTKEEKVGKFKCKLGAHDFQNFTPKITKTLVSTQWRKCKNCNLIISPTKEYWYTGNGNHNLSDVLAVHNPRTRDWYILKTSEESTHGTIAQNLLVWIFPNYLTSDLFYRYCPNVSDPIKAYLWLNWPETLPENWEYLERYEYILKTVKEKFGVDIPRQS